MYLLTLGFLLGNCLIQSLPTLPDLLGISPLLLIFPLSFLKKLRLLIIGFSLGFLWTLCSANFVLMNYLPKELIGKDLTVQGLIEDVPNNKAGIVQYVVKISHIILPNGTSKSMSSRVQLSVKATKPPFHAGETWQFKARLNPIHGFANPGSFDQERWAFAQRLVAKGYITNADMAIKLSEPRGFALIQAIREKIANNINLLVHSPNLDPQAIAIIAALTIGVKNDINQDTWAILSKTGTSHLIAISGLHIGLVAGMLAFLAQRVCISIPRLALRVPAQKVAAVSGIFAAIFYSALAGFSIPTQRALVMVIVAGVCVIFERAVISWQTFCLALLLVLLWDPLASLTIGFWLSFGSVGFILLITTGRLQQSKSWHTSLMTHKAIFLGLIPLSVFFFDGFSVISPVANGLAIPYVSVVVVPLALIGVAASWVHLPLANFLWDKAVYTLKPVFWFLGYLSDFSWSYIEIIGNGVIFLIATTFAVITLLTRFIPFGI